MELLKRLPFFRKWSKQLNNVNARTEWVKNQLGKLPSNTVLLDAGCGSQQFRVYCDHLIYKAQDFGQYTVDDKQVLGSDKGGLGLTENYQYGKLDYIGDIWNIDESDNSFDAIMCTEVFEHIPHPIETIKEFSRLMKPNGKLILTAPSNCLRHFDPYFFYSGFSDRWYEKFLTENGFQIEEIVPVGDYYSWLSVEIARTAMTHSILSKVLLTPAFLYFFNKRKTEYSVNTLCAGYHVVAKKIDK